ncbi:MDR family MFS transporter [Paenibacillus sp. 481]|uniref:MDR family MFS transporter n=1 Tax=Paenibacillus sp. 481 TaxID=2835869 RepID=UPI001E373498|nr:MDR family MFS transporter [Paenibacillus sp. 481]UHA75931.1 MFS transporter [Paenibacillus sp. 481]
MSPGRSRQLVTMALLLSTFLAAIEVTVVSTAIPQIVSDLGGLHLISWIYAAYLLTTAVSTPLFGKLSDLYGRKNIFIIGSVLFVIGSMLCGLAENMTQMVIYRAIQGIGAGAVLPVTFTIIGDIYNYEERAKVQGLVSSIWGIAGLVGPLAGGFFVDSLSWHWIFFINIPFGFISVWMIMAFFKEKVEPQRKKIDYAGAITFTIGMTMLLFALITGGQGLPWSSPYIVLCLVGSVILLVAFYFIELKAEEPIVPLELFRIRDVAVSNAVGFLVSGVLIGINSYMPLWIQGVLGMKATDSGMSLTPMSIGWLIGAIVGGRLLIKSGARITATLGMTGVVIGAVWLASLSATTPIWVIIALMFLSGLGFGLSFTVFTIIVQSSVAWNVRGASTALHTFVRTLGQTLGIAAFGTYLNASIMSAVKEQGAAVTDEDLNKLLSHESAQQLSPDMMASLRSFLEQGLSNVFLILVVIAVISLIITLFMPKRNVQTAGRQADAANTSETSESTSSSNII